jgi:hypothetical protein
MCKGLPRHLIENKKIQLNQNLLGLLDLKILVDNTRCNLLQRPTNIITCV